MTDDQAWRRATAERGVVKQPRGLRRELDPPAGRRCACRDGAGSRVRVGESILGKPLFKLFKARNALRGCKPVAGFLSLRGVPGADRTCPPGTTAPTYREDSRAP